MDILVGKAVIHEITERAQNFVFDLTCNVIGEAEVNDTWLPSTNRPEFSNAARNFQIGAVV